jgi:hypothetical protein
MRSLTRSAARVALSALLASGAVHATLFPLGNVVQVEAGDLTTCALTASGAVKCWGRTLGDGSNTSRSFAGDVLGLSSGAVFVAVSRGGIEFGPEHACAIVSNGGVKCWGSNGSGQLGDGTTINRLTPVDVAGLPAPAVEVALGHLHTCALLNSGAVKCWGANAFGQLGDGTTADKLVPTDLTGLSSGVAHIAAAAQHTCAVTSGGGAKCWGSNSSGQLGDGTTIHRLTPVDVQSLATGVAVISPGGSQQGGLTPSSFTCALTAAGGVKCWGSNNRSQLGDGTFQSHLTPFDVLGLTSGVRDLSAGGMSMFESHNFYGNWGHACAIDSSGGVKCWGGTPTIFGGLTSGVTSVAAGGDRGYHICALLNDGSVRCGREGLLSVIQTGTGSQAIVFGAKPTIAVGGTGTASATGGSSGNPVTFTSLTPSVCSVSGSTVTGHANDLCTIAANQAGNAYYDPALQVSQTFRIGPPLAQTISWVVTAQNSIPLNGVLPLQATASSGLKVVFSSNTPSICSVSGTTVTGLALGSCTITASQPGDDLYAPAPQIARTHEVVPNSGTVALYVTKFGTGTGSVASPLGYPHPVYQEIICDPICAANLAQGSTLTLTAGAASGSKFAGWTGDCSGTGTCVLNFRSGTPVRVAAHFVLDSPIPRLANISTRGLVLSGENVMIAGFIIDGTDPKTVVVRAAGPSLASAGVVNALPNPFLTLVRSDGVIIAQNDNWQQTYPAMPQQNAAQIEATGFAPSHPLEPAVIATLAPGAYTAHVQGSDGISGVGLVAVFEVDRPETPFINISTRGWVDRDDGVMIAGFIVQGESPQTVVVNVAGPSLAANGITNPLANPTLTIVRSADGVVVATNDDWQAAPNAAQIAASGFQPNHALEPAVLATLPPGAYTAIVRGVNNGVGTAVVGVFAAE